MIILAAPDLRLDANALDYAIVAIFFLFVLGIGFVVRRSVASSSDFFLSGRSLPAWVTGFAFISANLGALEILGMAANGAEYGLPTVNYYWVGAVPAMVFLGLIMMPFYYGSRVRSVPEYLRLRFNAPAHLFQSISFAVSTLLIAGVNLFALALMINVLIGWPLSLSIVVAAVVVLTYTTLGGLSAAIYNEVLQFFIIVAGLLPLTVVGLIRVGGWTGLTQQVTYQMGDVAAHAWAGTSIQHTTNPFGNWIAIAFGLGFVLSFGYWTTNFAEVQRALSARDMRAARLTPIVGAYPKMLLPFIVILPGLIAGAFIPQVFADGLPYNDTLPLLMNQLLPNGLLGVALAGLLASFMAGMAANVSAFNTVFTYDIWQPYVRRNQPDQHYLRVGRAITVIGVLISIGTAFLAASFNNIMNYFQVLNSFFNAPLFATFIVGMFWRRMTPWAGFWGLVAGVIGAIFVYVLNHGGFVHFDSEQAAGFYGGAAAFAFDFVVTVVVSLLTRPKPEQELQGLVWGLGSAGAEAAERRQPWFRSPVWLGGLGAVAGCLALSLWLR